MKTIEKKEFDCVDSVRQVRIQIANDLKGKTEKEVLSYFSIHSSKFKKRLAEKTKD